MGPLIPLGFKARVSHSLACFITRVFHKLAEIANNGNIGIIGFQTSSKQKIQQQNVNPVSIEPLI